jgi:PAS domain S-box-containing protein
MAERQRGEGRTGVREGALSLRVLFDLVSALPTGVAVHSGPPDFRYLYANPSMLAFAPDRQMLGRPFAEVWPEMAEIVVPLCRRAVETGEAIVNRDVPFDIPPASGAPPERRYFDMTIRPLELDGERGILAYAEETTEEVVARQHEAIAKTDAQQRATTLDEIFERMADGFVSLDEEWRFRYVNKRAEDLLQRRADEILGKVIWDEMPDSRGSTFYKQFTKAMKEQRPVSFEEYYAPLDMWAGVHAFPSPSGLSVFLSNITSQKHAESALGRSEGQLRALIENSPDVVQMKDLTGRFLRVNCEFAHIFGMQVEDLVGKTDFDLLPKDVAQRLRDNDVMVARDGTPHQFEEDVALANGREAVYLTTKFPLKDSSGRVYGVAGISTDITDRKRQERQLIESEERFRKIFEEGPVGIVLVDTRDFRLIRANDTYAEMLGYTKPELERKTLFDVTYAEDNPQARTLAEGLVRGEIPYYRLDKRYVRKDGTPFWVTVTGSLLRDEQGRPSVILGMVQDITNRKMTEQALREKDQAIRTAYSEVIAAVTGGKLILVTPDEMSEMLGERVGPEWHVDEYSQFSKVRAELAETLQSAGLSPDDCEGYVLAAGEAMTNAVKHGGVGTVAVHHTQDTVQIEVADHGPGIDFEYLPKATLVPGFSTKQSLGMGFTIMLEVCDRVLLTTQPGLTVLALEKVLR